LAEPLPNARFPIVRLTDVHLDMASDAGTVNILRGITLDIAAGEITAVVGPSGAGKSSLMMVAGGLERATSGKRRGRRQ
jgi:putative ABC transport system ATP-binding protein